MSPTSTDHAARPAASGFRRTLVITFAVLGALTVVLAIVSVLQGPRLSSSAVDTDKVTTDVGQQLRLVANQAVAQVEADQVTVTPDAAVTVSTQGEVIAISFAERLHYATEYEVRVEGVTSVYEDRESTFTAAFSTGAASLFYLDRAPGDAQDRIVRTGVASTDTEVLFEAPRIQSFAVLDDAIAVATIADSGRSGLALASITPGDLADGGAVEELLLPATGVIGDLAASPESGTIGFTFTSDNAEGITGGDGAEFAETLMRVDLLGTHTVEPVAGLDGSPLQVLAWHPLPGTADAVVQTTDSSVLRIDLTGTVPDLPLGQFTALGRPALDGETLDVSDLFGDVQVDLSGGDQQRLETASIDGVVPFGGELQLLGGGDDRVQQVAVISQDNASFRSYIVLDAADGGRVLYQSPDGATSIDGFDVAPNAQYVAVEVIPGVADAPTDGYAIDPRASSLTTLIIDVETGQVVRSLDGFDVSW